MATQPEYEIELGEKFLWAVRILVIIFMGGIIVNSILNPPETVPCNENLAGVCPKLNLINATELWKNYTFPPTFFENITFIGNLTNWTPNKMMAGCNYPPECGYGWNPNLTCEYQVLCLREGKD